MIRNFIKILSAISLGILIAAVPYGVFVLIIEKIGLNSFHMNPQLVAVMLGSSLLGFGGYCTGKLLAQFKIDGAISPLIVFSTPGLYIGVAGFIINFLIDGKLAKDSIITLSIILLTLFAISAPFTIWGFKRNIKSVL